jgi:uncharacterized protein (TIGR00375 family)
MEFVADLHLHSKYSRAVSKDMTLQNMAIWANKKGLNIISCADWTHPLWRRQIRQELEEAEEGLFKLKNSNFDTRFLLSVEISSIYSQQGKIRRIHNLVWSPSFETSEKISNELIKRGANLSSDGRPTIGLSSIALAELVFSIDDKAMIIPCHVWTPWFSLYGANSGFDSIEDCFGEYSKYIYGVETGLSSDPFMNWQIKELENRSILSFSDAHSMAKMGREATVFMPKNTVKNSKAKAKSISYEDIRLAIMGGKHANFKIGYTIEFYPEEGKYHYTGHRNCNFVQSPDKTKQDGDICPICGKPLTIGVMHRVEELSGSSSNFKAESSKLNSNGVKWIIDDKKLHPPFVKLVPLLEIIAESMSSTVSSQRVIDIYNQLCKKFGSEIAVLLKASIINIEKEAGEKIAEGIKKVRSGEIVILPGFDGQYGIVKIWEDKKVSEKTINAVNQLGIDF